MERSLALRATVQIVGPAPDSQGGVASVIRILLSSESGYRSIPQMDFAFHASICDGSLVRRVAFSCWQLARFAAHNHRQPWILHVHMGRRGAFWRKAAYVLLARMKGARIIVQVHPGSFGDFYSDGSAWLRASIRSILKRSDALVALTKSLSDRLTSIAPGVPVFVVGNPLEKRHFAGQHLNRLETLVAYVGWHVPQKGVYELVDAIDAARKRVAELRAVFAGGKGTESLRRYVQSRGLSDVVEFPGWLPPEDVRTLLQRATLLALPSHSEGLPMVLLEAMACGTPIITTPVGGIPEVLVPEVNAVFVPPGDAEALSSAIVRVVGDPALRARMSDANRAIVDQFDVGTITRQLVTLYEMLLRRTLAA